MDLIRQEISRVFANAVYFTSKDNLEAYIPFHFSNKKQTKKTHQYLVHKIKNTVELFIRLRKDHQLKEYKQILDHPKAAYIALSDKLNLYLLKPHTLVPYTGDSSIRDIARVLELKPSMEEGSWWSRPKSLDVWAAVSSYSPLMHAAYMLDINSLESQKYVNSVASKVLTAKLPTNYESDIIEYRYNSEIAKMPCELEKEIENRTTLAIIAIQRLIAQGYDP